MKFSPGVIEAKPLPLQGWKRQGEVLAEARAGLNFETKPEAAVSTEERAGL